MSVLLSAMYALVGILRTAKKAAAAVEAVQPAGRKENAFVRAHPHDSLLADPHTRPLTRFRTLH